MSAEPVNLWSDPAWAQRYLGERDGLPHHAEAMTALMEVVPRRPRRVLDLGTGDGYTLGLVRGAVPSAEGVGVDFSAEMLGRARARFADDPAVEIVEHDLDERLPATLGRFDLVVSSFAIHHCVHERKRALYAEVFDLLDPGGTLANLEHVASATPALHVDFLAAIGKSPEDDDPSNKLLDVETQLCWLRQIGFDHVDCHWKWRELALLCGVKPR
ncbi:MAG: class I SAM-dependent methyltransferase [Acidimicrobiia bacterium]